MARSLAQTTHRRIDSNKLNDLFAGDSRCLTAFVAFRDGPDVASHFVLGLIRIMAGGRFADGAMVFLGFLEQPRQKLDIFIDELLHILVEYDGWVIQEAIPGSFTNQRVKGQIDFFPAASSSQSQPRYTPNSCIELDFVSL